MSYFYLTEKILIQFFFHIIKCIKKGDIMITQKEFTQVMRLRAVYATKLNEIRDLFAELAAIEKSILNRLYSKDSIESGRFLPKIKYSKELKYINWKKEFRTKFPEFYINIKDSVGKEELVGLNLKDRGLAVSGEHKYILGDIVDGIGK